MSQRYQPSNSSTFTQIWRTIFLSQRDLAGQVPINFVTQAGISITAACFGNGIYDDDAAQQCFSNLLALGYRRFIFDLYWEIGAKQWSFCPIAIPTSGNGSTQLTSSTLPSLSASTSTSSTRLSRSSAVSSSISVSRNTSDVRSKFPRQDLASSTIAATASSSSGGPVPAASSGFAKGQPMNLGPVTCTSTITLDKLVDVLQDYMESTENTLEANILYLIFNVHVATSTAQSSSPALAPSKSDLPSGSQLVGSILDSSLGSFIYTPNELKSDRADLNESWYSAPEQRQPIADYFTTEISDRDIHSTPDGWPCENYIEVSRAKRLLLSWGSIDPQMDGYNFSNDTNTIFSHDILTSPVKVSSSNSGTVTSGCIFDPKASSLAKVNSSWALTSDYLGGISLPNSRNSSLSQLSSLILNLTACGISPILNVTLLNTTASSNSDPYQNVSYSSVWSWAFEELRNFSQAFTTSGKDDDGSQQDYRCAVQDATISGRWRVEDCGNKYHAACRVSNTPYDWVLTSDTVPFSSASNACPNNSTFGVPRTGLENSYLYSHIINSKEVRQPDNAKLVWVNFNSLDVRGCWTTGGANATCPYTVDAAEVQRRTVLVPTIAAIIVLIVTALTLFVKCNANRRSSRGAGRRKKRGEGGWDYEGVPS